MSSPLAFLVLSQLVCGGFAQYTFDRALYNDSAEIKDLLKSVLRRLDVNGETKETYKDCSELKAKKPETPTGIYEITTEYSQRTMKVYCDMSGGEGWTVIQRRQDGTVNFTRNWLQYKYGFGNLSGEFWLGNDNIYHLTNQDLYRIKIEMTNFDGETKYATYSYFYIKNEARFYQLQLGDYIRTPGIGDAGDSMRSMHNGKKFSTHDEDNDHASSVSCVTHPHYNHGGGWWFGNCDTANLNGAYLKNPDLSKGTEANIEWGEFTGSIHWIKRVVMKLRPMSDFD